MDERRNGGHKIGEFRFNRQYLKAMYDLLACDYT